MAKCVRNEILADLIRGSAQDVIDMADQIAAVANEYLNDFDIWLRFPEDGEPTIEISSSTMSKRCHERISEHYNASWRRSNE